MFNCQLCDKPIGPKVSPIVHVVERRVVEYRCGSVGSDIVKEVRVCKACSEILTRKGLH